MAARWWEGELAEGVTLFALETRTGSDAERLYRGRGWTEAGSIPDHAGAPDGTLVPTTIYWKRLA